MSVKDKIKTFFKGELLDDEETLSIFSKDASLFEIKPQFVLAPINPDDIKRLVRYIIDHPEEKLSITVRSGGTDMSGGAVNDSIILDMTSHFNHILSIGPQSAVTQPGVYYRDFERESLTYDLILPCYPASRELCTMGGMAANNSAGEKTLFYGQTENFIKSLKVVLSDGNEYTFSPLSATDVEKKFAQTDLEGEIYRGIYTIIKDNFELLKKAKPKVSKNTAGYYLWNVWDGQTFDLTKLLVGSQGTLGIITEIEFKLIHPNKHSKLLVIFLKDLRNLGEIVNRVLEFHPESFESYDDYTLKFAMRFLPEVVHVFKPKSLLSLGFQFIPEMIMTLTGGMPKLILLAEFTGNSEIEVDEKCQKAQSAISQFKLKTRITGSEEEARKYWTIRRESFNLLRRHVQHKRTAPFIDDIVVKPEFLPEFLPKLRQILDKYKLIYTIAGHIGNGNFHIIPLMDFSDPRSRQIIPALSEKVYNLVFNYKGSMTAEHNDGMIRGPYLEKMYGEKVCRLFRQVKKLFDPQNIFNPHKKIDADLDFTLAHICRSSN